ncbi:MAG: hypothetical protein FJ222_03480 [Lentisphaerae bacterium]|nr:hypothetical protein [Lentisphaerota bacterium]
MTNRHLPLVAVTALLLATKSPGGAVEPLPGLVYHPEGDAIVVRNGDVWNNRPLYCNRRMAVVLAGEMPSLNGPMGMAFFGIQRGETRVWLHHFAERVARYRAGRMEWELSDSRFPGMTVRLTGTTLADANGFTARLIVEGSQPGDGAAWCVFGRDGKGEPVKGIRLSDPVQNQERLAFENRNHLTRTGAGNGIVFWTALSDKPQFIAVVADGEKLGEPATEFADGLARVVAVGRRVVVETPDPYFDAGVAASSAAVLGLFVEPCFVHGGSMWRYPIPGWRTMGGAINYGWHDLVATALAHWDSKQVKRDDKKTQPEYSANGCQQSGNSRFFGTGFLNYPMVPHYEFQTQFFDEAVRAWRATADPAFEKRLLPMLELHLQRCRECYDPDGDGLYESYNNTWPNDSIWFNGGGTSDQSAYMYYGFRAAAEMQQRAGNNTAAKKYTAQADTIHTALNRVLWLKDKGHFASHIEQGGHQRVHEDAWIYAQHVPIEAGMTTPEQAWRAMDYTEWAMERFLFPFGGEMRQTSNFVPGQWSIRELYHGDNFAMALGYFLGGIGDTGWDLLRGTMLQSMYGDPSPRSGFSNEAGVSGRINIRSPGGLSHPNCGIDFNDITTQFARAVVEGLFGYRPDYPNAIVRIEPAFPSAWDHASIRTPDFTLSYRQNRYQVTLTKPAAMKFRLPVRAAKVKQVLVNGQSATYRLEPWAGYGALFVDVPACSTADVVIETDGPMVSLPVAEKTGSTPGLVLETVAGDVPRYHVTKVRAVAPVIEPMIVPAGATWKTLDISGCFNGDVRTIFQQEYRSPRPNTCSMRIGYDGWRAWTFTPWKIATPKVKLAKPGEPVTTPQGVPFGTIGAEKNIAFTSLWDNWPKSVMVPVNARGDALWLLVCGSTNPMQGRIVNAVLRFRYTDGQEETLELVPPLNFWSLCGFGRVDYDYKRDGFALPKTPPPHVQLGENCRAMVYGHKLRPDVDVKDVTLETLSQEVVIGLMSVSVMNPK